MRESVWSFGRTGFRHAALVSFATGVEGHCIRSTRIDGLKR